MYPEMHNWGAHPDPPGSLNHYRIVIQLTSQPASGGMCQGTPQCVQTQSKSSQSDHTTSTAGVEEGGVGTIAVRLRGLLYTEPDTRPNLGSPRDPLGLLAPAKLANPLLQRQTWPASGDPSDPYPPVKTDIRRYLPNAPLMAFGLATVASGHPNLGSRHARAGRAHRALKDTTGSRFFPFGNAPVGIVGESGHVTQHGRFRPPNT